MIDFSVNLRIKRTSLDASMYFIWKDIFLNINGKLSIFGCLNNKRNNNEIKCRAAEFNKPHT